MALLFCDSFSHYAANADALAKWGGSSNPSPQMAAAPDFTTAPRPGMASLYMTGQNGGNLWRNLGSSPTTVIFGGWFRTGTLAQATVIFQVTQSGTEHFSVRYTTGGAITATRNGTVLATSSNTIAVDTWYHIECKVTIGDAGDSPSGRYQVRVNGTSTGWIPDSGTGQDTRNGGSQLVNQFHIYKRATNTNDTLDHRYADVYILDDSGSVANDFLGPCRIVVMRPDGPGNSADWAGNYADNFENAREALADGDTTFNQTDDVSDIDLFAMTGLPSGTVHAVQHVMQARQDTGSGHTIRAKLRIAGTNYNGTTKTTTASHVLHTTPFTTSPATSSAWTDSELNGAEAGYELVS